MMRVCLSLSVLMALVAWGVLAEPLAVGQLGMREDGPGPGTRGETWLPYPTPDPLVWAADACLGFFLTRTVAAFGRGVVASRDATGIDAEFAGRGGRIRVEHAALDEPQGFHCGSLRWPELEPSRERLEAVGLWIGDRLKARDGWEGWFEAENPSGLRFRTIAEYRNTSLGVTLRIEALHDHSMRSDYLAVRLDAEPRAGPLPK